MRFFCRWQACFDLLEVTTVGIPSSDNNGCKLTNKGPPAKPRILKDISGRGCPLFRVSPSSTPVFRYHPLLSTSCKGRYGYHICGTPLRPHRRTGGRLKLIIALKNSSMKDLSKQRTGNSCGFVRERGFTTEALRTQRGKIEVGKN